MRVAHPGEARQNGRMTLRALLLCGLLAGCATAPPADPVAQADETYAGIDLAAIRAEADDLDRDQLAERMEALRDNVWETKAPAPPADATVSIELAISSGFARFDGSTLLWRQASGQWQWHRASHSQGASPAPESGVVDPAVAKQLEQMLESPQRRAEIWYSPNATPMTDGTSSTCFDGASYLMVIRRTDQAEEFIVQSCQTRWRNGDLINLIGRIGRD